ncbi:hypothetical protein N7468_005020 [Penicillium chermesinum]|uniref:Uncharacterized protein n=1 Tax=Penicillium chermesinum TaxID=63820 RepID=A0A9W9NYE5_9EURO|nr:uncharacterized protein N7468_005020 [Penicillium chermesinum]KAJ5232064.1 hypothetical protein N7468_005020 [Penicillium chermesinum]KAJ6171731.1 hypothetical protein N7470_000798 [Penicillium chermesinum]
MKFLVTLLYLAASVSASTFTVLTSTTVVANTPTNNVTSIVVLTFTNDKTGASFQVSVPVDSQRHSVKSVTQGGLPLLTTSAMLISSSPNVNTICHINIPGSNPMELSSQISFIKISDINNPVDVQDAWIHCAN